METETKPEAVATSTDEVQATEKPKREKVDPMKLPYQAKKVIKRYWLVVKRLPVARLYGKERPAVKHETEEAAKREAQRLADKENIPFEVVKKVATVYPSSWPKPEPKPKPQQYQRDPNVKRRRVEGWKKR